MLTKIKHLKGIGKFYAFEAKGAGLDWQKNTFLFAPNAYGKSTIVEVFRSLSTNDSKIIRARKTLGVTTIPEAVVIIDGLNHVFKGARWDKPYSEIQIFDVPYIQKNILSHEIELEHRKNINKIIIGAQGIKLAEELATLKKREKEKRQQVDDLEKQFSAEHFSYHTVDTFLAIPSAEEAAVQDRIQKLELDIKSKETEKQARALVFPDAITALSFDLSEAIKLAALKFITTHEAAEEYVLKHIELNFKNKDQAKEFIRQGLDLRQADCPFCGQELKEATELLQAYQMYFDETFRMYQQNITQQVEALKKWNLDNDLTTLVSVHNANNAVLKQWEPFIGTEVLPDAAGFVGEARAKLRSLKVGALAELEKKQRDPKADVNLSQIDALAAELSSLKANVEKYNKAVNTVTEKAKYYVANLPISDVETLRLNLVKEREIEKRFTLEWKKWAIEYPAVKKQADDISAEKIAKQTELEGYTKSIFDTYQKRINVLLSTLGADFEMTDLTSKTDERAKETYSDFGFLILKKKVPLTTLQDDAPCLRNTLSEGDKSTLAFAFFIAALEKRNELEKQILVFDDPLSSLDENRREATAKVLMDLSPTVNQLIVCTHKKDFLWMLCDKISNNNVLQIRTDKTNGSRLEPFDVEEDRKSDHAKRIEGMERYVEEDFGPTPDMMQANIRLAFETVLKTKYYRVLKADIKGKKGFAKLLTTLFDAQLIAANLKTRLFDLCSLTSGPHHGEIVDAPSRKLTRDELIPLIKEALVLLEKV